MKKPKRKKVRFSTIKFKITAKQKSSIENYCRARGVTPTKIIKMSIKPLLQNYTNSVPDPHISPKQLQLFQD